MGQRQNWCKHYNGYANHRECDDGHDYEEMFEGCHYDERPCLNKASIVPCPSKVYMSDQEVADHEQKIATLIGHLGQCDQAIAKQSGSAGTITCPKCGGTLHWSRAGNNGHVWGSCETNGCLRWVE
jgi:hypothetical protein